MCVTVVWPCLYVELLTMAPGAVPSILTLLGTCFSRRIALSSLDAGGGSWPYGSFTVLSDCRGGVN